MSYLDVWRGGGVESDNWWKLDAEHVLHVSENLLVRLRRVRIEYHFLHTSSSQLNCQVAFTSQRHVRRTR